MTYLYYDKDNPEEYIEYQNMLIEFIEKSETNEEKEYFQRALMVFRIFGSVFI